MQILDCTLRDGGYYTNWNFDLELVHDYIETTNKLPIEYLEIGYRSKELNGYYGEYFYCPDYIIDMFSDMSNKKLAVLVNEKDISPEEVWTILSPCIGKLTMIRIAVNPDRLDTALLVALEIKKLGFEVAFNLMYMSKWMSNTDFINSLCRVDGIVDYLYLVDSYGGIYPADVKKVISQIQLITKTQLGFHGHNNLELALINTLTAKESGVSVSDVTVTGMGRGAGNLSTELLLTALDAQGQLNVDYNALAAIVEGFTYLKREHEWGTNLAYMVSGGYSLPQKDVMQSFAKRYYSLESIIAALTSSKGFKNNESKAFDKLRDRFKSKKIEKALLIGGGSSISKNIRAIEIFLKNNEDVVLIHASAKNSSYFKIFSGRNIYCLVGNEGHRLREVLGDVSSFSDICVVPKMPRKMGTYVPDEVVASVCELEEMFFSPDLGDAHTAIALQACVELGIKSVYAVGYDGYTNSEITKKELQLSKENESIFDEFSSSYGELISLTETKYELLKKSSVYAKIC